MGIHAGFFLFIFLFIFLNDRFYSLNRVDLHFFKLAMCAPAMFKADGQLFFHEQEHLLNLDNIPK